MRFSRFLPALALAGLSTVAWADDENKPPKNPDDETTPKESTESTPKGAEKSAPSTITFAEANARFDVTRDASGVTLVRLATPNTRIARDPVVVVETEKGPREVVLVPVQGQTGTWRLTSELPSGRSQMMRIMVGDRTYTSPWIVTSSSRTRIVARHGGWIVPFDSCGANVEVVRDPATGTLTIYSPEDVKILEAPVITITETEGPATVSVTPVDGKPGVWRVTHESFKTRNFAGSIRLMVNGKPCTAPLAFAPGHGGRMVNIAGAPPFEVVRRDNGSYVFYAVDETFDGKPYTITNPTVVYTTPQGPRTVTLNPVADEPRAWELVGTGADFTPNDARLRFTLFGKTLEGNAGLSGLGLNLR